MAQQRRLQSIRTHLAVPVSAAGPAPAASGRPELLCAPPYAEELPGCRDVALSQEEVRQFKESGFVVKRGLVDPASLARVREHVWQLAPPCLSRDPATWADAWQGWTAADADRVGPWTGTGTGNWKLRSRGTPLGTRGGIAVRGGIGTEPWLLDLTVNHPSVRAVARQLIGAPLRESYRVRGIYNIFPRGELPAGGPGANASGEAHTDGHAGMVGAMVFCSDVPPRCGGFTV